MTATTELREAASRLRRAGQAEQHQMGFASRHLAWNTASWLIEEADTLDLLHIEPTTSLEVARHILKAAA